VLVYVMRGTTAPWTDVGCCAFAMSGSHLYGTAVIEGNGQAGCGGVGRDLQHGAGARAWTQSNVYGYPLAYLVFDPVEAVADGPEPTATPLDPQETCAVPGGGSGSEIHGIIYSGGSVEFDAIDVDGGVVAFQIQAQGSSSYYRYNPVFGHASPPPGFPEGAGNTVVLVRKTAVECMNYAVDTGGGSPCP
jgi:hypothetical protein